MAVVTGKAECIKQDGARGITLRKIYPCRPDKKAPGYIKIKNDNGEWKSYQSSRFLILG